jgi:hypothetical protein
MSRSQRPRLHEIRRVHQLLEEVNSLGVDPAAWRSHMLQGLCQLTHARVGITTDVQQALPGEPMLFVEPVAVGFEGNQIQTFSEFMASDQRLADPGGKAMLELHARQRFFTQRRHEMIGEAQWYASPVVSEGRRSVNIDHYLVSSVALDQPGWWTGFALYRNWGDQPFDEKDRRLMRLFHAGLLRRLRLRNRDDAAAQLPVYLRQMLRSLLRGHTAQESTDALGLSPHTVKSYTKEIYARLGVNSRGAVAARFYHQAAPPPIFLPAAFDSIY